ncbi:sensor histidine kinase [Paenibacillus sp. GCM10027627]|uniref:sensor histidine kinase n=1 Tax=unclassified Paenibacillus TaxID=185978 RepID=UPI00363C68A7
MQRNIWLIAISIVIALILINNTIYYFLTKQTLENDHKEEMLRLGQQIESAVEQSRMGAEHYEEQISRELRAAAIAAQYALDPDIEKVTNEQLAELSEKLGIAHISLMKRAEGDIIIYRSSDPSQPGTSTKTWDPWHRIFNALLDGGEIKDKWLGQEMEHFWSGPFEVSSTEKNKIYKWGYYYDGTTNYIIDPYIEYTTSQEEFNKITGVERLIDELVRRGDSLLEIALLNPRTFPDGKWSKDKYGDPKEHLVQRPHLYGTYNIKSERDVESVRKAYASKEMVSFVEKVDGRHVNKMFIPVFVEEKGISITDEFGEQLDSYVLSIVTDYGIIQNKLNQKFLDLGIIIFMLTFASLMAAIVAMRYYKQSRDKAVREAQETYTDEINSLFNSIRAQRHDFLNHVQTIHSLAALNKHKELVAYTKELTGEIKFMNDIINIGNPAIAALIRSKISQAESYKINFECSFNNLQMQDMGAKTLDVNRILGNLIDNAFDEVQKYEESKRDVQLAVNQTDHALEMMISNTCLGAAQEAARPLFESGYSTKNKGHQGLGLSIVKSIAERYKGEVYVRAEAPERLAFYVRIPL